MALRRLGSQAYRRRSTRGHLQSFFCSEFFPSNGSIRGVAEGSTDIFWPRVSQFPHTRQYGRRRDHPECGSALSEGRARVNELEEQKQKAKTVGIGEEDFDFEPRGHGTWRSFPVGVAYARGARWFSSPTRVCDQALQTAVSHATASQYSKEEEEKEVHQVKVKKAEASAEDCDQAVVGLSSAKAKMKQAQEPPKKNEVSMVTKFWNILLGIGPAIKAVASMSREDWAIKIAGWKKSFRAELQHYWIGTKLLWADVRISVRLMSKLAGGKSLSRRERQQLTRTTADIFRLVPFAVFIIVPFMELLLPVFLKLFPNMLPSTFQDKMKEQEELKKRLNARIQYAKFLQETVGEMAKELKSSRSGDLQKSAKDLDDFMSKVRKGVDVHNEEILGFAKLFNDELTLDNISRPRLVSMCKYMGIQPYGTDAYLRYSLRTKLAWIKADDRLIQKEGVESLSEGELRSACRERGMLGLVSIAEMQQQLRDWLDLSLNHSVPSSLLILSRSFVVTGRISREDAIEAALSSLPEEVVDSVQAAVPSEDALAEAKRKLELLHEQEKLIKEEAAKELEEQQKMKMEAEKLYEERLDVISAKDARDMAKVKADEKQEQLCKISSALAILASASSVSKERADFLNLVNSEIQLYNSMVEKEGTADEEDARRAYRAAREDSDRAAEEASGSKVSSALIGRIDAMLHKLEKDLDDVDAKIGDRWKILDRDSDGKVTPEEVATAAMFLKDTLGQGPLQELISNLAKDPDGKILVEDIVKLGAVADLKDSNEVDDGVHRQFT